MKRWHGIALGVGGVLALAGIIVGILVAVGVIRNPRLFGTLQVGNPKPQGKNLIIPVSISDAARGGNFAVFLYNATTGATFSFNPNVTGSSQDIVLPNVLDPTNPIAQTLMYTIFRSTDLDEASGKFVYYPTTA